MNEFNLEDRMVDFSASIIQLSYSLPSTPQGKNLCNQIIRSGTSVSLNYGEAQSAESKKDFLHKMRLSLKELRETFVCLKIIRKTALIKSEIEVKLALKENNELISIFISSINTALNNSRE